MDEIRTVLEAVVLPSDTSRDRYQAEAIVKWSDDSIDVALRWYDDEIRFVEADFLGKTQRQINELFHERDIAYIQS